MVCGVVVMVETAAGSGAVTVVTVSLLTLSASVFSAESLQEAKNNTDARSVTGANRDKIIVLSLKVKNAGQENREVGEEALNVQKLQCEV